MNFDLFIDMLVQVFPGKELTPAQFSIYREKLRRFDDDQRHKIYDWVIENCRFFPKIADIYEAALELDYLSRKIEYQPHAWQPNDCQFCGGSGLMAALYEQEFEILDSGAFQILRLVHVGPYHQSAERYMAHKDEVRQAFRCACPRGDVETLQKGIQRWSNDRPVVLRRAW